MFQGELLTNAHDVPLYIDYDDCVPVLYDDLNDIGDGYDEKWYTFLTDHLPVNEDGISTIRYYIAPTYNDLWYDLTYDQRDEIIDGIIVLVDEDVQAYLNGSLVFYNKDELPEIS